MLTEVTCIVVRCDTCGQSAFDAGDGGDFDNEVHFATVEDAESSVRDAEWIVVGDRVTCGRCAEKAACDLTGHDWGEWHDYGPYNLHTGGYWVGRARWCGSCGGRNYDPPVATPDGPKSVDV